MCDTKKRCYPNGTMIDNYKQEFVRRHFFEKTSEIQNKDYKHTTRKIEHGCGLINNLKNKRFNSCNQS